eukprot:COSAG02_NODE_735_length_17872_cov_20.966860_13_plen_61_part_00
MLAIAVRYMAGASYHDLARVHGTDPNNIHRIINKTLPKIVDALPLPDVTAAQRILTSKPG